MLFIFVEWHQLTVAVDLWMWPGGEARSVGSSSSSSREGKGRGGGAADLRLLPPLLASSRAHQCHTRPIGVPHGACRCHTVPTPASGAPNSVYKGREHQGKERLALDNAALTGVELTGAVLQARGVWTGVGLASAVLQARCV